MYAAAVDRAARRWNVGVGPQNARELRASLRAQALQVPPVLARVAAAEKLDHHLHARVQAVHRVELGHRDGERLAAPEEVAVRGVERLDVVLAEPRTAQP